MKDKILQILKTEENYISGQEIGERLNVSRTAIWKAVNALKNEGYVIESVNNKGYHLISCPDVLLSSEITSELTTKWWGKKLLYFDTIDSTNNEIKRQAEKGAAEGLLAISEEQTAGRGRRGRNWTSPKKTGIWMSFLLKPDCTPMQASMMTIVAALACCKTIREVTGLDAMIKWPNDIVINGKKTVGILTEMSTEMTCVNYVVVGIGFNVNMENFPKEISSMATSICIEKGSKVSRSSIVAAFGNIFEDYYDRFMMDKSLKNLKSEYDSWLINIGRQVIISSGEDSVIKTADGINDSGELIVHDDCGNMETVRAGEVSVRGLYGYT